MFKSRDLFNCLKRRFFNVGSFSNLFDNSESNMVRATAVPLVDRKIVVGLMLGLMNNWGCGVYGQGRLSLRRETKYEIMDLKGRLP